MEHQMRTVSWSLRQVDHDTAQELWVLITLQLSVQMKRLLNPLKIGLKSSLVLTLTLILGIFGDKIATDLEDGIAVFVRVVARRAEEERGRTIKDDQSRGAVTKGLCRCVVAREACAGGEQRRQVVLGEGSLIRTGVSFVREHSADAARAVVADLSGCVHAVLVLFAIICVDAGGVISQLLLHAVTEATI
ncbi:uncharacterized protein MONOS_8975 [Monocercomonoides exilis]|uniref:uncharacterized protein n=1 Tax=Monocercomonoides exilis TaxID=2049356 RepID=UPI00355A76A4|nr:hypothetical protein MONOS_8975 [Monocercomonoides exilis]|eukprot:MONOS_8975.1-p1 / transcript=MONOS_8975.1 / gene=MONOS_8975 / organism=Monocercomonoides_exilis_PA203 / gene_product=unspecified product / transcript_product=unspecified product / location=Mono_scaffold00354:43521-44482(+) / protein_length=190 / sequence_SO=supercontig / SO=protein_coding / is_pseudo=false